MNILEGKKKYSYYTRDNYKSRHLRKQTLANIGDISITCDELFPVCGYIHYTPKQKDAYSLFKL